MIQIMLYRYETPLTFIPSSRHEEDTPGTKSYCLTGHVKIFQKSLPIPSSIVQGRGIRGTLHFIVVSVSLASNMSQFS